MGGTADIYIGPILFNMNAIISTSSHRIPTPNYSHMLMILQFYLLAKKPGTYS